MRPWIKTVLKVVVTGVTMCSGIVVSQCDVSIRDAGNKVGIKQDQRGLDRAA